MMTTQGLESDRNVPRQGLTMRDVASVLFRHKKGMLIALIVIVAAFAASGIWVPTYQAEMKILVQRQRSDMIITPSANAPVQNGNEVSEEELNSEVELLRGEDLLQKVVLSTFTNGRLALTGGKTDDRSVAKAVRKLGNDLAIEGIRKTQVISVRYQSHDPGIAAEVLRRLAACYTEKHAEVHHASGEFKFFDQETASSKRALDEAQQKLTDFSNRSGIVSAEVERDAALQRATEFDAGARQTQAAISETAQRIASLREQVKTLQPRVTTTQRNTDNAMLLQDLKTNLLTLEQKRTTLTTRYNPSYPLVKEVDQQIAEANAMLHAEEANPVREETTDQNPTFAWARAELSKNEEELNGLKARAASARSSADEYRTEARRLDQNGMMQRNLLRDAKVQEDAYLLYVHKRQEAGVSDALDQRGILNVAIAEQPSMPFLPTRSPLNLAFLLSFLCLAGSISTAVVCDALDQSFRTPSELSKYLELPVLAALPKSDRSL